MGLSTAVSGFLNYKMLFFCSLLSLQKISIPDLPYSENSLITSVIPKHVISALLKSTACCYHPMCLAVLQFLCTAKKCFKIVCRNDHAVLSKYKNILWILLRCLELLCLLLDWVYSFHVLNKLPWTPTVQGFHGLTPPPRLPLSSTPQRIYG